MRTSRARRLLVGTLCAGLAFTAACTEDEDPAVEDGAGDTTATTEADGTTDTTAGGEEDPLGPIDEATGTPVRIGMIADGVSQGISNEIDVQAAEATIAWINERRGGLAGHVVELDVCVTNADPGTAVDCANRLIADGVVAVAVSNSTQAESFFPILAAADMPTMFFGATSPDILADDSTFALTSPTGQLTAIPAALAEEEGVTQVTAVVIDVPAAVDAIRQSEGALEEAGLTLEVVPVAPGTADMTPQMQQVVSSNSDGVVTVVGNDSFCIAAFNGLRTAGFEGTVTSIPECITDATRTSVPGDFLEGIRLGATTPFEDKSDPSIVQYLAVLDAYGDPAADRESNNGAVAFTVISSLITAASGVEGDVTPASVLEAIRTMDEAEMLGTGGQTFKCDGQADPAGIAICSGSSVLVTSLDASGNPTTFTRLD